MATTKVNYHYTGVQVTVEDNKAKWEADKPVAGVIAHLDTASNTLSLIIPEPQTRDTTKNPALAKGDKTGMEVTVRKDGTYGFSWRLKQSELRLIGQKQVEREFKECMTKLFEKIG